MSAVNDLEGSTYMNQSLPFGGCKRSGFDRFAGPEGLRGLCHIRSVAEDRISFMRTKIPPPIKYPASGAGDEFGAGLVQMTYGYGVVAKVRGLVRLLRAM